MRKVLVLALCVVIILVSHNYESLAEDNRVISSWATAEVEEAEQLGLIIDGLGNDYTRNLTRLEFCGLVVNMVEKAIGSELEVGYTSFSDTDSVDVSKAYSAGIANGTSAYKFSPNNSINRQEIVVMLIRAIRKIEIETEQLFLNNVVVNENIFTDQNDISPWALSEMKLAKKFSIMNGIGEGKINPLGNTTVEQAILLVKRVYVEYYNDENRVNFINSSITGQEIEWVSVSAYENNSNTEDAGVKMIKTSDDGYIMVGTSSEYMEAFGDYGDKCWLVVKVDKNGNKEWESTIGVNLVFDIIETKNGDFVVLGQNGSGNYEYGGKGYYDAMVVRLDSNGEFLWRSTYGGNKYDVGSSIVEGESGFLITGRTRSASNQANAIYGGWDAWLLKISDSGDYLWNRTYGSELDDSFGFIKELKNGNYIIGGSKGYDSYGYDDYWLLVVDGIGNIKMESQFGQTGYGTIYGVEEDHNGDYLVVGSDSLTNMLFKVNSSGVIIWEMDLEGAEHEGVDIKVSHNNEYYVSTTYYDLNNRNEIKLTRMDSDGNIKSDYRFGGNNNDILSNFVLNGLDEIAMFVSTTSSEGDLVALVNKSIEALDYNLVIIKQ